MGQINWENVDFSKIKEAYWVGNEDTRKALLDAFGEDVFTKPTLDNYKSIRSYEDACVALGEPALNLSELNYLHLTAPHLISLMKLETISRALWGRNWRPDMRYLENGFLYLPAFNLYNTPAGRDVQNESKYISCAMVKFDKDLTENLVIHSRTRYNVCDSNLLPIEIRLCQRNSETAIYFGEQFFDLWMEYLKFNFKIINTWQK